VFHHSAGRRLSVRQRICTDNVMPRAAMRWRTSRLRARFVSSTRCRARRWRRWPKAELRKIAGLAGQAVHSAVHCERKRSNPENPNHGGEMDCFVACAPRNDGCGTKQMRERLMSGPGSKTRTSMKRSAAPRRLRLSQACTIALSANAASAQTRRHRALQRQYPHRRQGFFGARGAGDRPQRSAASGTSAAMKKLAATGPN